MRSLELGFTGLGIVVMVCGVALAAQSTWFQLRSVTAEGTVVDTHVSQDAEGSTSYQPVIAFTTRDGEPVRFTDRMASSRRRPTGQQLQVRYRVSRPKSPRLNTPLRAWFTPCFLVLFGALFVVIGHFVGP